MSLSEQFFLITSIVPRRACRGLASWSRATFRKWARNRASLLPNSTVKCKKSYSAVVQCCAVEGSYLSISFSLSHLQVVRRMRTWGVGS